MRIWKRVPGVYRKVLLQKIIKFCWKSEHLLVLAVLKTSYRFYENFKRFSTDLRGSGRGPGEVPEWFEKDLGGFYEVLRGSGRSVAFPDRSGEVTGGFGEVLVRF